MKAFQYIQNNFFDIVLRGTLFLVVAGFGYVIYLDHGSISKLNCSSSDYCSRNGVEKSRCYIDRVCDVGEYDQLLEAEIIRSCRLFGNFENPDRQFQDASDHYCITQSKKISTENIKK